jgi:hypothetical protein
MMRREMGANETRVLPLEERGDFMRASLQMSGHDDAGIWGCNDR